MNDLGFIAFPAIVVICYLAGATLKAINNEVLDKFIPVICGFIGGALGVIVFLTIPGYIPAENWLMALAIGIVSSLGMDVRFFRTAILDEMYRPYVLAARAKGLSRARILVRHVLRNALIPIVTYVSLSIPYLFTGSLLLESFFGIPGLGSVSINAIHSADMAVVRAVVVLGALLYQFVNLATDLAYAWLDPRVRFE